MKPVRLGFIGLGLIPTSAHLPGLAPLVESGDAVLQAFCDVDGLCCMNRVKSILSLLLDAQRLISTL